MCAGEENCHDNTDCCSSNCRIQRFLEPCILLLLAQKSTHGYNLIEKLSQFGFKNIDPGTLYRYLRDLEENGMLNSHWNTEGKGPAKRVYGITEGGYELLMSWGKSVADKRKILDFFLRELEKI